MTETEPAAQPNRAAQLPELDTECPACQGRGIVTNPDWLAYHKQAEKHRKRWEEANPDRSWYASPEGREVEDGYPDEAELGCGECDCKGRQLTEAGRVLLAFMRTHGKR